MSLGHRLRSGRRSPADGRRDTLTIMLRTAAKLSLLAVLVSCGGPTTNTSPVETAVPGETATAQVETGVPGETATGDETAAEGTDGGAVQRHDDPELEALLPDEMAGAPLKWNSYRGRESIEAGGFEVEDAATSLDRDLDDVSIATATLEDGESEVLVIRVDGASGDEVLHAYRPNLEGFEEDFQGNVMSREGADGDAGTYIFATDELYVEIETTDRYYVDVVLSELR
jgi:hypothetical protein